MSEAINTQNAASGRGGPRQGDVVVVKGDRAACDGGDGALGHPVTYYRLDADGMAVCKYCDRIMVREGSPAAARMGLT